MTEALAVKLSSEKAWNVRYVKEHLYYHLGNELNVIDVDIEWPETIDFSTVKPLQRFLSNKLFQVDTDNLKEAYRVFRKRYGEPVTRKFDTLPDDRKYCYIECSLKQMAYSRGHFISYRLFYTSVPASLSSQKGDTVNILFTYDLIHNKILLMQDVLRSNRISGDTAGREFIMSVISGANTNIPTDIEALFLTNACLYDKGLIVDAVLEESDGFQLPVVSVIGFDAHKNFFSKVVVNLFRDQTPVEHSDFVPDTTTLYGVPFVDAADVAPSFHGGMDSLQHFLSKHVHYPDFECINRVQGSVLVAFVIDVEGQATDIRVIRSVSPVLDREAARVISMMPRWTPAMKDGKAVAFKMVIPIKFQIIE